MRLYPCQVIKPRDYFITLSITAYATQCSKIISRLERTSSDLSCIIDENVYESANTLLIINGKVNFAKASLQNCLVAKCRNFAVKQSLVQVSKSFESKKDQNIQYL